MLGSSLVWTFKNGRLFTVRLFASMSIKVKRILNRSIKFIYITIRSIKL